MAGTEDVTIHDDSHNESGDESSSGSEAGDLTVMEWLEDLWIDFEETRIGGSIIGFSRTARHYGGIATSIFGKYAWIFLSTAVVTVFPLLIAVEREQTGRDIEVRRAQILQQKGYSVDQIKELGIQGDDTRV